MENKDIRKNVLESAFGLARALRRGPGHPERSLPPAVERTLMVISENDGLSSGELCEFLDMRPSSISELSDRMADRGLIEKRADESDKRVNRIFLTELGKAQVSRISEVRTEALNSFSACFTDEEAAQFCELAAKLSAHLNENASDEACRRHGPHKGPHGCCRGEGHGHGHGGGHHGPHGHCLHRHPMHRF